MDGMEISRNLSLFKELVQCNYPMYFWEYDGHGQLIDTNCPELALNTVFVNTGCMDYMLEYGREHSLPIILSAKAGLMWGAVYFRREETPERVYVLGPVFTTEMSFSALERNLLGKQIPLAWRAGLMASLRELPVVSTINFLQYTVMLHYCVTGERVSNSSLHFQSSFPADGEAGSPQDDKRDRHATYTAEQALLRMVREGDKNYASVIGRATTISTGVGIQVKDPLRHAKTSGTVFTSLCVRAAIEGGLSPESAYSRGDAYLESIEACTTVSEVIAINHAMYDDFIECVHKLRVNSSLSPTIQSCIDYIELHTDEKLLLESLAERFGYTKYYLSRRFRDETGEGINDYIKYARVERAKLLLSTTNLPIQKITEQLSFCSRSHFSQVFQAVVGQTPVEYRKQHQRL